MTYRETKFSLGEILGEIEKLKYGGGGSGKESKALYHYFFPF